MADGSIIIDTQIDTSGVVKGVGIVKAGMNRLSNQIAKMGNEAKSSFQKQIMGITDLYQSYEKQERKVSELKAKLEELSKVRIETEEYKKLGTEIKELEDNFVKVEAKQKEWLDMGFPIDSAPLKELDKQMNVIWADIEKLQQKQKEMKISGAAYINPMSTEEYKRTAATYSSESQKLERVNGRLYSSYNNLKNKIEEYWQKNNRLTQVMEKLQRAASRVGIVVKNMGSALRSAGSSIKSMVSAMKKAVENMFNLNKQTNQSRMSLSRMLGMSLLFSGVFRAISVVGDGVKTGFQNLAQYSNSTNSAISSLMSALTRLKNSFATAFAPILTTVAPILTSFINLISEAVTRVGMLIAALTGKDTFTKAIGVQENYAASLDKSSKSANKAKKATKGYLSSLDEVKRYDDGKSDSGTGSGGKYTGPSASEMFETVPIENSIKGIADKIKQYIESQDWEGLGSYMADGINNGLEKVYNVINWDNVGPRITPFISAFTTTFNSLVDNINWDLMGQTVGTGINTIAKSLNLAITGIDWYNLGKKFAKGIKGIVKEVDWKALGQLIGNKFMISWRVFSGFVKNLPYASIGRAVATALNGVFSTISFPEIGNSLATAMNGAFTALYNFVTTFDWTQLVNNIAGGINAFVSTFDWKGNGEKLEVFLSNLCDAIVDFVETTDWEAVGSGIGTFLSQLDWLGHLKQVTAAIVKALKELFDGLEASGTAGKIASFIGKAFLAVKVANITGISTLVSLLIGHIGTKIAESKNAELIASRLSEVIGKGTEQATGALEGLGNAAEASGGQLGGFWSQAMNAGATAFVVQQFQDVKTAMDIEDSTTRAFDDFGVVRRALELLEEQTDISGDKLIGLGGDISSVKDNTFDFDQQFQTVITTLENAGISSDTFKAALKTALEESNVSADENIKKINEYLGNMDNKFDSSKATAETKMSAVSTAVGTAMSGVQSATEKAMSAAERSVSDHSGNINTSTGTNWGNSTKEVDKNLDQMKQHANLKLGEMQKTVESHFSSQYNTMTNKWKWAGERIEQIISEMIRKTEKSLDGLAREMQSIGTRMGNNLKNGISSATSGIIRTLNGVASKVNSMIGNINSALSGIERAFTFSYNVQLPDGGRRWGNYSMSLPRVSNIPYLASGAVIPPRSEFLAVLGDQKNGRNLEAPEDLLRQIVREEAGGNQGGGGNFRFTAQLNRRTIFDEMIEEAKLRRDASGNNPFELS